MPGIRAATLVPLVDKLPRCCQNVLSDRGGELLSGLGDRQPIGTLDRATAAPAISVPVSTEEEVNALDF